MENYVGLEKYTGYHRRICALEASETRRSSLFPVPVLMTFLQIEGNVHRLATAQKFVGHVAQSANPEAITFQVPVVSHGERLQCKRDPERPEHVSGGLSVATPPLPDPKRGMEESFNLSASSPRQKPSPPKGLGKVISGESEEAVELQVH